MRIDPTIPQKEETYQFWYTVKKVKNTNSYEFDLADNKCRVDVEVFRNILDICPRVQGVEFVDTLSEEELLTFLIELGYKDPLDHLARMFVDHIHQPWITLTAIINKCLSGKTSSNDRLRKSRMDILWGMFHKKNVDYLALIWEDVQYQIDFGQLKLRRCKIMPYPRFTKLIINHFLCQHKSLAKLKHLYINTIKDDGVLNRLKFVRMGKYFQEYGRAIPDTMLTKDIKQSEAYQTFLFLSTDPDVAFELGKSISLSEAKEEEEVARRVHATHELLVKESDASTNRPTGRRRPFEEERLAADTMQAIKASMKISRSWPHTGGSSKGVCVTPEVPDESLGIFTTSSEGTCVKLWVPDDVKGSSEAKADSAIDWGLKNKSDYSEEEKVDEEEIKWVFIDEEEETQNDQDDDDDDRSINIEKIYDDDDEETNDEYVHDDEYVHNDMDEEMKDAEDAETGKDDDEVTDAAKADAEKIEEVKDGDKKVGLPPTSSSLSVSSDIKIKSLLDIQIQQEVPLIQSPTLLNVHVSIISEQQVPTISPVLSTVTPVSTVPSPTPIISTISSVQQQTTPISTPPITTIAPSVTTIVPDPLPAIAQRVS
ncbi:hypothetical protein Tco_1570638 [Tanacetum coccineum]